MRRVVAVLNQKGGVGKTTSTINIAAGLANKGSTVLVIDLDPQANATSGLGIQKQDVAQSIYDVLAGDKTITEITIDSGIDNLHVAPATTTLAASEQEMVDMTERELVLKKAIASINYDYIFIDCPPSLGLLSINALAAADSVIIPVQTEFYALEGLGLLMQTIQRVQAGINPQLKLMGVIMTMVDTRNALSGQVISEVKKHFGEYVFDTFIPRNVKLAEAPSYGKTVYEHDKWSKGSRAYKSLVKEIQKRD